MERGERGVTGRCSRLLVRARVCVSINTPGNASIPPHGAPRPPQWGHSQSRLQEPGRGLAEPDLGLGFVSSLRAARSPPLKCHPGQGAPPSQPAQARAKPAHVGARRSPCPSLSKGGAPPGQTLSSSGSQQARRLRASQRLAVRRRARECVPGTQMKSPNTRIY